MVLGHTTPVLATKMAVSVDVNQTLMVSTVTDVKLVSLTSPTLDAKVSLWSISCLSLFSFWEVQGTRLDET